MKHTTIVYLIVSAMPYVASAKIIVSEDFESYANTSALGAVWSLQDGTLDTASGNPGQSLNHPGTGAGNTNSLSFTEVTPGSQEFLVFSADIFDDGGVPANERNTAGLRRSSAANIIEMGLYNAPPHYAYRVVLFSSPPAGALGGWVAFENLVDDQGQPIANQPIAGWHRFSAKISESAIEFSLDLNSDGNINATAIESITLSPAGGFDIVRLGGPSGITSHGGGVKFDNISLILVPEPATGWLVLLTLNQVMLRQKRNRWPSDP